MMLLYQYEKKMLKIPRYRSHRVSILSKFFFKYLNSSFSFLCTFHWYDWGLILSLPIFWLHPCVRNIMGLKVTFLWLFCFPKISNVTIRRNLSLFYFFWRFKTQIPLFLKKKQLKWYILVKSVKETRCINYLCRF